jgi:8-oxo-dGTP pyrophosphatase MutT (NUDIX family)
MAYLEGEMYNTLDKSICYPDYVYTEYVKRIVQGDLRKEDSPEDHFCVYFLPYDPKNKKVFIVHHKKSNLWLSPGGHIDKGESLLDTLKRETKEEIGLDLDISTIQKPFLFTITNIPKRKNTKCRKHFDVWYRIRTKAEDLKIDMSEFHDTNG